MIPLVKITSHPEIVQEIVGQFVFMILMSEPGDSNFHALQELNINDIFKKADLYFLGLTDFEKTIDTNSCKLEKQIPEFLQEWKHIVDITAIQQNIHHRLSKLDRN